MPVNGGEATMRVQKGNRRDLRCPKAIPQLSAMGTIRMGTSPVLVQAFHGISTVLLPDYAVPGCPACPARIEFNLACPRVRRRVLWISSRWRSIRQPVHALLA